jgi:iron-sulfur cluster repair protein YtfE (RIC family)
MTIRPDLTVNDLVRCRSDALPVLAAVGIDTCCGGGDSLALAAARAGLTFDELLRQLEEPSAHDVSPAPPCGCGSRHS